MYKIIRKRSFVKTVVYFLTFVDLWNLYYWPEIENDGTMQKERFKTGYRLSFKLYCSYTGCPEKTATIVLCHKWLNIPLKVKIYTLLCCQINGKTCDVGY